MTRTDLINQAKDVLNNNFRDNDGFTIPCEGLYPFQWNWDSGFIAIGLAHYNMDKAKSEVSKLIEGQWENGFIPHIIFHNDSDTYFPGPEVHQSNLHPQASKKHKTTGLTQPPVLGFALLEMYLLSENKAEFILFLNTVIDKVYNNHHYFYANRDPKNEGLVYIYHNWESGTDNSPVWDDIWETFDPPNYTFERRDTTHVNPEQRPTYREYEYYIHLIEMAKSYNYDDKKIAQHSPFLVQDPLFNAMLIKSNQALIDLYGFIGNNDDKIKQLKQWQNKAISTYNRKLFDENLGAYIYYDLRNERHLPYITSSSFSALSAKIPSKQQAEILVNTLKERFGGNDKFYCASFDPTHQKFNPKKYWRGPIWVNLNWILYRGLRDYNYTEMAHQVKKDTIQLISINGYKEYFDPRKEYEKTSGYGGNNFSWSAALTMDLLLNN